MARRPRLFGEKLHHHIYAWGNNRQAIFFNDQHYTRYLEFLEKSSRHYKIDIIAYALMLTHIHLFVYDLKGNVSDFMYSLHGEYARYFNRMNGRVGHVFGERFNNKIVQANDYGLWLSRYIHRQAVEAGLVCDPKYFQWSSYRAYIGEEAIGFVKPDVILEQFGNDKKRIDRYKNFVLGTANGPIDWDMRSLVVVGDSEFKQKVEERETTKEKKSTSNEEICEYITEQFGINLRQFLYPNGWEEKRLRKKIIVHLIEEVGLKPQQIAQLCDISRVTINRALRKNVKNVLPVPD